MRASAKKKIIIFFGGVAKWASCPKSASQNGPKKKLFFFQKVRRELRVRALLSGLPLLRALPHRFALSVGAALGTLAWFLAPRQRRLALEHLAIAFPEMNAAWRRSVGRRSFANLGRSALETALAQKLQMHLARVVQLAPEDEALLRAAHAEGKGVIVVSCHVGNWELFARRIAAVGLPSATVAKEAQDPRLTALLEETRAGAGVRVFWRGQGFAARDMLRFVRRGGLLGILIDQDTRVAGHFVPFFGRPAFTPRAAGDLAARLEAPMVFGCVHRVGPGLHRIVLHRIDVGRSGDREHDSLALTVAATKAIEEEVRARPDEWVWMHHRWRTRPPNVDA
jgi:KDO2-lipid IV(A) lauroyltransferase